MYVVCFVILLIIQDICGILSIIIEKDKVINKNFLNKKLFRKFIVPATSGKNNYTNNSQIANLWKNKNECPY